MLSEIDPTYRHEMISFIIADLTDQPIYQRRWLLELSNTRERMEYIIGFLDAQCKDLEAKIETQNQQPQVY